MSEEEKQTPQAPVEAGVPEVAADPEEEKSNSPAPLGGRSVFAYLAVLFGVAFLLLLFAYLMQQRDSAEIMGNLSQLRESMGSIQSIDELTEENRALREEKEALKTQTSDLEKQIDELEQQLDELQKQMDEQESQSFFRERALEDEVFSWQEILGLEQCFRTGDYDRCVVFFENALTATHYATPPEARERVEEIYWALVENDVLDEEDFPLSTILGTQANQQQ